MEIKRYLWNSNEATDAIKKDLPVILLKCPLCIPAMTNWTLERLNQVLNPNFKCDVLASYTHRFLYMDESKNVNGYNLVSQTEKVSMSFNEYYNYIKSINVTSSSQSFPNYFFQQGLVAEMGPLILEEYKKFSLETALYYKKIGNWDELTNNLLLCGKTGFVTPVHFDEQENLFAQLNGMKRVRLFHPDNW